MPYNSGFVRTCKRVIIYSGSVFGIMPLAYLIICFEKVSSLYYAFWGRMVNE